MTEGQPYTSISSHACMRSSLRTLPHLLGAARVCGRYLDDCPRSAVGGDDAVRRCEGEAGAFGGVGMERCVKLLVGGLALGVHEPAHMASAPVEVALAGVQVELGEGAGAGGGAGSGCSGCSDGSG